LRAEPPAEHRVQEVGDGMVEPRGVSPLTVDPEPHPRTGANRATRDPPQMNDQLRFAVLPMHGLLLSIRDLETVPFLGFDRPVIADLSARLRVEGRLGDNQLRLGSFASCVDLGAADEYSEHLGFRRVDKVPDETARQRAPSTQLRSGVAAAYRRLLRFSSASALLGHRTLEARTIDLDVVRLEDVLGEIERQSVSIVELERGFPRERGRAARP
jgi:hypothetical protein